YPVEEYQTQTGDYKLFEDTDSNPSEVTDSELVQFNLSETDVDCMSEEETANQAVVEDLITLEEDNSKQPEITPYLIFSESSHTSGGGSSKITKEEEPTGSNQEKDSEDKQEITEEENEDTDTDSTDTDSTDTDSTDSDQEDGDKTVESPTKKLTEFENKTNQEPVEPYEINSDQESDTLYVRHTSSSEEASPEKKNKEREIISETNLEDSDKEIQIPSPTKMSTMTAMDASQTVGNLSNIFQGVTAMAPSTTSGSTEGYNIIGTFGDYFKPHCWSKNCKELVNYEGEKCRSCNQCARHGCDGTAPEVRKWCSDCRYKCKVPGCHKNRKPGEHNCENHSKEEPAPCAWSGCKQPAETSRDFCKECQENVNKMCEVWQCYEPKCNESAQFCRGCWDKKYEEAKRQQQTSISQSSNQTKSNSTSGSGSNEVPVVTIQNQGRSGSGTTTIELGSDGKPTYECLIDACDKRVRTKGEKCEDHKYCEHVGCKEEAPFAFRYCKRCQLCCRADGCFSTREWKKAYCKSHLTTKAVPCAIFGCKRKTGDQAWEFCNECVKEIIKLGEKTGCDVCQIPDPSCYDCQCVRILQEYNEIRKEALKSKNVTFDTQSSSSTTAGSSTTGGPRPILRNHTNSIISSISPLTGNNSSFISSASSNSIGTKDKDKRNNNNSQSYNGRPRRQNAYISQEEDTLSTLAATVGELAKKVENLKGDGSAKNTNEHPQTVPDCVTCDAEIWGTKVKAIVDTGSSGSIISKQCLDQLKRKIEESSNVSLIGINGQKHRPLGMSRLVKSYKWSNIHWRKDFNHYCLWDNQQTSYKEEVHSIPTNCPFPQNQRAYHYPPNYNEFIKEEIQQMLENGIIRESTSSWASPIVVVKKKNNKLRFCVDYRKLNAYTEQDKYPLPLIADIFDSLEGSKYFSSLDLASGYWQMEVAEEDKKKTAFISKHGLYEFNRMPFGLTNAPASFQRLMNKVLSKEIGRFVVVYLDDINIYSKSFEEHLEHLEIVFSRLRQAGLKLGKDKCSFAKTQLEFLGHIVGRDGLQPDPKKVEKVRDWPTPKTVKEIRSFLGLASYYRRFMKDFSKIAKPINGIS
ncbi:9416_t:CDS:2, partial [Entrophospora sp. SA101]